MKIYTEKELRELKDISLVYLLDIEVDTIKKVHEFYKIGVSRNIANRLITLSNLEKGTSDVWNKGYLVTRMNCIGVYTVGNSLELEKKFHRGIDFRLRYLGKFLSSGNSEIYKKDSRVLEYGLEIGLEFS